MSTEKEFNEFYETHKHMIGKKVDIEVTSWSDHFRNIDKPIITGDEWENVEWKTFSPYTFYDRKLYEIRKNIILFTTHSFMAPGPESVRIDKIIEMKLCRTQERPLYKEFTEEELKEKFPHYWKESKFIKNPYEEFFKNGEEKVKLFLGDEEYELTDEEMAPRVGFEPTT